MSLESPPRLKHGELGPVLRAADAPVTPERIASNRAAIAAAIAKGVARTWPLWLKLGLPLLLLIGGYVAYRALERAPAPRAPVVTMQAPPAIDAPAIDLPVDAAPVLASEVDAAAAPIDAAVAVAPRRPRAPARVVDAAPPPDAAPPTSDLPAQIALYEEARAAAAKGEVARGIAIIDELLRRFPSTQLRAEAELTRAELLTRAGRLVEAAAALEALAVSPAHRGRRGELLRALGDVRRKQGDCRRAVAAYMRAREARLNAAESIKVDRGLERCAAPK